MVGKNTSLHISSWYLTLSWTQTGLDFDREIQNVKTKKREIIVITKPAHWLLIKQDN